MADFYVITSTDTDRVLSGGDTKPTAGAGQSLVRVDDFSQFDPDELLTDYLVDSGGVATLTPKLLPTITPPTTGNWASGIDELIALDDDANNLQEIIQIANLSSNSNEITVLLANKRDETGFSVTILRNVISAFDTDGTTDITSDIHDNDGNSAVVWSGGAATPLFVGNNDRFTKLSFINVVSAIGSGTLIIEYWNGSAWTALTGVTDATESGGDSLGQNGIITFDMPTDWDKGGGIGDFLSNTEFFVRMKPTSSPTTDPNVNQITTTDPGGGYIWLETDSFASLNLSFRTVSSRGVYSITISEDDWHTEVSDTEAFRVSDAGVSRKFFEQADGTVDGANQNFDVPNSRKASTQSFQVFLSKPRIIGTAPLPVIDGTVSVNDDIIGDATPTQFIQPKKTVINSYLAQLEEAPTGADLIIDIDYGPGPSKKQITVSAGTKIVQASNLGVSFDSGEGYRAYVSQVGSTNPGKRLYLVLFPEFDLEIKEILDESEYTINYDSVLADAINSVSLTTAPETGQTIFFSYFDVATSDTTIPVPPVPPGRGATYQKKIAIP